MVNWPMAQTRTHTNRDTGVNEVQQKHPIILIPIVWRQEDNGFPQRKGPSMGTLFWHTGLASWRLLVEENFEAWRGLNGDWGLLFQCSLWTEAGDHAWMASTENSRRGFEGFF